MLEELEEKEVPTTRTFDGLSREQLLIYARELADHFWNEDSLRGMVSQREQYIRELTAASITAQEEEREWIAYEVHDRIAQTLASVFQQLQMLESMTRENPAARQVAVRGSILLREAIRESRNIMNDLHPPVLDEFGIVPLIEEELRHFHEEMGCQAGFDANYQVRPSRDVEVALYRIFHEALINVRRHSTGAKNVTVTLSCKDHVVNLQVEDDGLGFDVEAAVQGKRVGGLMSMRRRAEVIGGNFEVTSSPGHGTIVSVYVPLNDDARKGEPWK